MKASRVSALGVAIAWSHLCQLFFVGLSDAFVMKVSNVGRQSWQCWTKADDDTADDGIMDNMDVELEVPLPQETPFLTTMEKKRRETEIALIQELLNGDKAIAEFKKLWFSERGPKVEKLMYQAELGIGQPPKWNQTMDTLLELTRDDPTYIEPYVRLSKLYCLQGRFDESLILCQHILKVRPWHFVCIETMIALNMALGNADEAQFWAAKRLPTPSNAEQRDLWVQQAIQDATAHLETTKDRPGALDEEEETSSGKDDVWQ